MKTYTVTDTETFCVPLRKESETMQLHNLTIAQAARLLNKGQQFVRIGLQRDLLGFGKAVKVNKHRYIYHISVEKFMEYSGYTYEEIVADYLAHHKTKSA